jgi:hypothetical protein
MCKKLIYSILFIMLLSTASSIQAALEPFSLPPTHDAHVGNDTQLGPDQNEGSLSAMYFRDIDVRRRVSFVSYDISELQSAQSFFSNVRFSNYGHDIGTALVYGVIEELDNIDEATITWNNAPGVKNDPAPAVGDPVALDYNDLTPQLYSFIAPVRGTRQSTEPSQTLADFLNSDTDGIVTFMFAPLTWQNDGIVRTKEMEEEVGGTFLEGLYFPPPEAIEINPTNAQTEVQWDVVLSWKPGFYADKHDVYFGTDVNDVNQASTTDPRGVLVNQNQDELTYDPPGVLELGLSYYWRIDEVNDLNPDSPWKGNVWSFTVANYIIVDDFEDYNDYQPNTIFETWLDGYGDPNNGSTAGYPEPDFLAGEHYLETTVVHGGDQSMPLCYDNSNATYSEVTANADDLSIGQDWTIGAPEVLALWLHGEPGNNPVTEQLYVKINNDKVVYNGDIVRPWWRQWYIDLAALGTNLNNVTQLSIGLERTGATGGTGVVFIDDIRLYQTAPAVVSEEIWIEAEAADTITVPMQIYDDAAASGGKYIGTDTTAQGSEDNPPAPDGTASYTFTVDGGTYTLQFRVLTSLGGNSLWVWITGATTQTENHSSGWVWFDEIGGTEAIEAWSWGDVSSSTDSGDPEVLWTMEPGVYTLDIAYREPGAALDAIVITKLD